MITLSPRVAFLPATNGSVGSRRSNSLRLVGLAGICSLGHVLTTKTAPTILL